MGMSPCDLNQSSVSVRCLLKLVKLSVNVQEWFLHFQASTILSFCLWVKCQQFYMPSSYWLKVLTLLFCQLRISGGGVLELPPNSSDSLSTCVGAKHSPKGRRRDTKTTLDLKAAPLVTVDSVIFCGAAYTFGTYRAWSGILIIL